MKLLNVFCTRCATWVDAGHTCQSQRVSRPIVKRSASA